MDTCSTATDGTSPSPLLQLPELQWVQGESWGLQGLAGVDPCSGGSRQPLCALDSTIARVATRYLFAQIFSRVLRNAASLSGFASSRFLRVLLIHQT